MNDDDSEASSPRPRRKIKRVVLMSSSSDSDSDESVGPTRSRKKRLRVLSDDEGSESSGSSIVLAGVRRHRRLPKLRDSADSNSSGWESDPSEMPLPPACLNSGFASDSSEGNSDKCSICLLRFKDQEVGIPQTCEHIFCLDCITEWSKNVNTCPVDRKMFNSIVVRACAGGQVLRTEPVHVVERRPSVDILVVEDPTVCEICGNTDNEETMLLCDGCDLGYHMECLTPPLTQVPVDQWLCPSCGNNTLDDEFSSFQEYLAVADDLLGIIDLPELEAAEARATRRAVWNRQVIDEPSTSSGLRSERRSGLRGERHNGRATANDASTRAKATRSRFRHRSSAAHRTKRKRRSNAVVIQYEVASGAKCPVTKKIKRRVKKRKSRQYRARTAARVSHVRGCVRARLAALAAARTQLTAPYCVQRQRVAAPHLNLFSDANQLHYFSDEEPEHADSAGTVVAVRPPASALSAYRQARRKMITIPSPPAASAAPDLLSDILETQTLFYSKRSVVSIAVDGRLDIKLEQRENTTSRSKSDMKRPERLDLSKVEDAARKVPSYPGQARGGGWGGGYGQRGTYREPPSGGRPHRASYGSAGASRGGLPPQLPPFRDDDAPLVFPRGPRRYSPERTRPPPARWPPHARPAAPADDALDMRTAGPPTAQPTHHSYRPLPEPPVFKFDAVPDLDKSEDERSDSGLVIDTEKYDPTEPTRDDDSGDEDAPPAPPPLPNAATPSARTPQMSDVRVALAGLDPTAINVPPNVLDNAVRQVLEEHRNLITAPLPHSREDRSDDDSDGDCPNFSIYSATSVHIASDAAALVDEPLQERPSNDLEDLVQEDDDAPPPPPTPPPPPPPLENTSAPVRSDPSPTDNGYRRKTDEEYKERVSKRCPITTSTRNPIKIKLNAPSLIKRPVTLYDDEDVSADDTITEHAVEKVCDDSQRSDSPKRASEDIGEKETVTPDKNSRDPLQNDEEKSPYYETVKDASESKDHKSDIELEKEEVEVDADSGKSVYDREDKQRNVEGLNDAMLTENDDKSETEAHSEQEHENTPERERKSAPLADDRTDDALEKMTESISETEDERSYTPCLDENKSKDTSFETDRDKGIEGLDTEMISEDEGDEMFSDEERAPFEKSRASPDRPPLAATVGDADRKLEDAIGDEDGKKKKKKESKKDKEKKNKSKKSDVTFKKPSKSGKERNYREREKDDKSKGKRERRESEGGSERDKQRQRRKEKRKDLERYDVRTIVSEKRKRLKDAFGRDVSPAARSPSPRRSLSRRRSPSLPRRSPSRGRRSSSPVRRRLRSPSPASSRGGSPAAPRRTRRSPIARSVSPRRSPSPRVRSPIRKRRKSGSPRRRRSGSRARRRRRSATKSPRPKPTKKKKRSRSERPASRPHRRDSPRKRSPKRKKAKRRSASRSPAPSVPRGPIHVGGAWSPPSVDSRLLSPYTPPPDPSPEPHIELEDDRRKRKERRRRDPDRPRRKRGKDATGPSKEVFTSGDNILVSVSFKDQDRTDGDEERRARVAAKRERRRRRRRGSPPRDADSAPKPVAIIDLERSPFRELTPSPKNVIVLSDSDPGDKESAPAAPPPPEPTQEATFTNTPAVGPKTPPEPASATGGVETAGGARETEECAAEGSTEAEAAPAPPLSPDAYDPFEPTRSASASPTRAASPPRSMTLEAAQKTNMSADEVLDRRPLSPIEKVMALLQSTRDVSPEPPPAGAAAGAEPTASPPPHAPTQRIVLPEPAGGKQPPKLFLAKPSPIKSNPVKPMQATKISKLPLPSARRPPAAAGSDAGGESPYSPGSSDFVDLFDPPSSGKRDAFDALFGSKPIKSRKDKSSAAKVPVKLNRKKGNKTQVGVQIDEDNLKILDDLPSSAVEMQVKSKFLKKLNRQERVVEEVKLVLKPHYNKKHVTKDEYKDILRRAVPKICHNKSGEINPAKIQALVEAYVKKFRKKHKLGLV